jgi:prophage regulatory protein
MANKSSLLGKATVVINSVTPQSDDEALDRLPKVMSLTGLPRPTLYAMMARGEFPASIDLGLRSVAWVHSEVMEWIKIRIQQSRTSAGSPSRKLPKKLKEQQNHKRAASARSTAPETTSAA